MDSLDHLLLTALTNTLPTLSPDQLQQRLARRNLPILTRPPRAWCLAIRAADTRIAPPHAILFDAAGCGAGVPPARQTADRLLPSVDAAPSSRVTSHASIPPPNSPFILPPSNLSPRSPLRINPQTGQLPTHYVLLTQPLLAHISQPLFLRPYTDHRQIAAQLGIHPNSLERARKKGFYEHKFIKGLSGRRGRPVPCLYTDAPLDPGSSNFHAPPDPVWGGAWQYAANSLPADFRQPVLRRPLFQSIRGLLRFRGLHWQCPGCEKLVRTLYFPLPRPTLSLAFNLHPVSHDLHPLPQNLPTFACHTCHRVRFFSRTCRDSWNQFVAYVSDGLLFGHEVPRPDWYRPDTRKRPYKPRLGRPPSQRRQQILPLLLQRQSDKEIAAQLDIQPGTVRKHIKTIYKQNNVTNLQALARKLNLTLPPRRSPKREQILRLRAQGLTYAQISRKLGITKVAIHHHIKNHNKRKRHHPSAPT